jgi:hypothetical protein
MGFDAVMANAARPSWRPISTAAIHPDELPCERHVLIDQAMDSFGLSIEVGVERTDDDPSVMIGLKMQTYEILSIEGKDRALIRDRKGDHLFIGYGRARFPGVVRG